MPRKFKIYLDTSAISHLDQPGKRSEFEYTRQFWRDIEKYDVYISEVVIRELSKSDHEKAATLFGYISDIEYTLLDKTDEVYALADRIIQRKILPPKSIEDARHIAHALAAECDYLLTWNMNHLANVDTNEGIRLLTFDLMRKPILIIPPSMLVKKEASDDDDA
ncbi:MAG: type II toxin-antitoxin system VapC family toxin [Synergistaceae bacterium]|jgi:predicted nucleic acid-binding protein|nr:type II toxin-antitoxin system VapC family toxin [Synergistaceae bacterium]